MAPFSTMQARFTITTSILLHSRKTEAASPKVHWQTINSQYGSFEKFKEEFNAAGVSVFGSGWVWLAKDASGKLSIEKESNAGNPITKGLTPILGFDVWEHSYYLDYQNRRADHLKALWSIIDWDVVSARY